MTRKWFTLLLACLLAIAVWNPFASEMGAAATQSASIQADQRDELITLSGRTSSDDPDRVPLLVTDAKGQTLYFGEVAGGGKTFSVTFEMPDWTEEGTAKATLYATNVETDMFKIALKVEESRKISVSLRIVGDNEEEILPKTTFRVKRNSSVFHLLTYAAEEKEIDIEYDDPEEDGKEIYIKSIDGLAEFDKGPGSGWVYKVNGKGPQMPVDFYTLKANDEVEFLYTTDFGESEGVGADRSSAVSYADLDLSELARAYNQLVYVDDADSAISVIKSLLSDLALYDLEKQKQYIPDVFDFMQAAMEQIALLPPGEIGTGKNRMAGRELDSLLVKELLKEQANMRTKLKEELDYSALYKHLPDQLVSTILIPFSKDSEEDTWKVSVSPEAWDRLLAEKARVAVSKKGWRADIVPKQKGKAGAGALTFVFRAYTDQEQTAQLAEWDASTYPDPVPLTAAYRLEASQPDAARVEMKLPVTGTLGEDTWPTLFVRSSETSPWRAVKQRIEANGKTIHVRSVPNGDMVVIAQAHSFIDIREAPPAYEWVREPVAALSGMGVVKGVSAGEFGLYKPVSRVEFIAMLARLLETGEEEEAAKAASPFADVPKESWFAPIVAISMDNGWVSGRDANHFAPHDPISRAEAAVLLARVQQQRAETESEPVRLTFTDADEIPDWAAQAVGVAVGQEWIRGRSDGRFDPGATLTRAEAAAVLYRYWIDSLEHEEE